MKLKDVKERLEVHHADLSGSSFTDVNPSGAETPQVYVGNNGEAAKTVHAINAVGRRSGRIIEIEDIDTGERVHGSARRLERLVQTLRGSGGELDRVSPETPGRTS